MNMKNFRFAIFMIAGLFCAILALLHFIDGGHSNLVFGVGWTALGGGLTMFSERQRDVALPVSGIIAGLVLIVGNYWYLLST